MLHSPSPALRTLITDTAIFMLGDTAVVQCVLVGDVGAATDTGVISVCTNVPAHVVIGTTIIISEGTLHVVVADDLTLSTGGDGGTVFGTLLITGL